jgi:hypothetical protein
LLGSPWRWPVLAGLGSLVVIVAGFVVLLPYLARSKERPEESGQGRPVAAGDILVRMAAGQKALSESKFHLALKELDAAVALRDRSPGALGAEQHRQLNQLQRQADLLDRKSPLGLEEILHRAAAARDLDDWKGHFDKTYRGKTIIFDRLVGRPEGRAALLGEPVHVNDEKAHVAIEDLTLLRYLPLDAPVRMLFGARLASAEREARGEWVVRFAPDSAVLLTDPGAAAACRPAPGVEEVLARQARWLKNVSGLRPAMP